MKPIPLTDLQGLHDLVKYRSINVLDSQMKEQLTEALQEHLHLRDKLEELQQILSDYEIFPDSQ